MNLLLRKKGGEFWKGIALFMLIHLGNMKKI